MRGRWRPRRGGRRSASASPRRAGNYHSRPRSRSRSRSRESGRLSRSLSQSGRDNALARGGRLAAFGRRKAQLRLAAKKRGGRPGLPGYAGRLGEMGHLRRLGGRWSALGGAWPDPKGPGRCLPTPWVPWVRAVPIGPLRWPGGRSWAPESAIWRPQCEPCVAEICPCPGAVRPTHTPEAGVCGPCTPGVSY